MCIVSPRVAAARARRAASGLLLPTGATPSSYTMSFRARAARLSVYCWSWLAIAWSIAIYTLWPGLMLTPLPVFDISVTSLEAATFSAVKRFCLASGLPYAISRENVLIAWRAPGRPPMFDVSQPAMRLIVVVVADPAAPAAWRFSPICLIASTSWPRLPILIPPSPRPAAFSPRRSVRYASCPLGVRKLMRTCWRIMSPSKSPSIIFRIAWLTFSRPRPPSSVSCRLTCGSSIWNEPALLFGLRLSVTLAAIASGLATKSSVSL